MNSKKEICVFDFDGTVVDSMERFADLAGSLMETHYGTPFAQARRSYLQTSGLPFREQLEVLYPSDARNQSSAEEFERRKVEGYFDEKTLPTLEETLQAARRKGVKIAVSSNNSQELVEEFCAKRNIQFDMVLGWKPNFAKGKDHFEHIQKTLNISSSGILFVGDSVKDAQCAKNNHVDFVGKVGTFTEAQFKETDPNVKTIRELAELKDFL